CGEPVSELWRAHIELEGVRQKSAQLLLQYHQATRALARLHPGSAASSRSPGFEYLAFESQTFDAFPITDTCAPSMQHGRGSRLQRYFLAGVRIHAEIDRELETSVRSPRPRISLVQQPIIHPSMLPKPFS